MIGERKRGSEFILHDRTLDLTSGRLTFEYRLDGEAFVETFSVPASDRRSAFDSSLEALLDLCHVVVGTSYFKLSAPERLVVRRPVHAELMQLARRTYDEGLREFAFRNDLEVPLVTEFVVDTLPPRHQSGAAPLAARPLVPVGGGKDSAAVLAMLPGADAISVSPTPVQHALCSAAGARLLEVPRALDRNLMTRSLRPGAMNGHIPITAINSAISVLVAYLQGYDAVVMANERSANEPTRLIDGIPINHQYSKSLAFELLLQRVAEPCGVAYFSMLRRLSEISIAGILTSDRDLRSAFLSCNRAFRRDRRADAEQSWCLHCPKCHFTFLCFALFLDPEEATEIFGGNPLANSEFTHAFRDLWSLNEKPFDCVGERAESALAMSWLGESSGWRDLAVVRALSEDARHSSNRMGATMSDVLLPDGDHAMPCHLADAVDQRAEMVQLRS